VISREMTPFPPTFTFSPGPIRRQNGASFQSEVVMRQGCECPCHVPCRCGTGSTARPSSRRKYGGNDGSCFNSSKEAESNHLHVEIHDVSHKLSGGKLEITLRCPAATPGGRIRRNGAWACVRNSNIDQLIQLQLRDAE
jgi:hypothetical protein